MKLPSGKVPPRALQQIVLKHLGAVRQGIEVSPALGLDGSVVEVGAKSLVCSMDPITGAIDRIGWLAVNINANDVATFGVEPTFFSSCILLPEDATENDLQIICRQIDVAAKQLNVAVIGGHSETTPSLPVPIVVGSCMGITNKGNYVTSQGAKAGNALILTKSLGIEGTAILASDKYDKLSERISKSVLKRAADFFSQISVVNEALLAFKTGYVSAMHDPTEGGVAGGIHEIADVSSTGFKIFEESLRVARETVEICGFFEIDPLQLIASGSLLIAAEKNHVDFVVDRLEKNGITANIIGKLHGSPRKRQIVRKDGSIEVLPRPESDHLWQALKQ